MKIKSERRSLRKEKHVTIIWFWKQRTATEESKKKKKRCWPPARTKKKNKDGPKVSWRNVGARWHTSEKNFWTKRMCAHCTLWYWHQTESSFGRPQNTWIQASIQRASETCDVFFEVRSNKKLTVGIFKLQVRQPTFMRGQKGFLPAKKSGNYMKTKCKNCFGIPKTIQT